MISVQLLSNERSTFMAFEDVEKMMARFKHVRVQFGPEQMKAVEIWESLPRYDESQVLALAKLSEKIMLESTEENRPELIAKFAALRDSIKELPDAPKRIPLWPDGKVPTETVYTDNSEFRYNHNPDFVPYLIERLIPESETPKGAVVVCPGGDHGNACIHEGYGVARELNAQGYQCFVVLNRPNHNPWNGHESGADAARAIRYVRANATKYRIDPDFVAFAGFSNGGLTGENVIEFYSGDKKVSDYFPDYAPDELDSYKGAMDAFLCVYGPRFVNGPFNWDGVIYPPVFYAIGREDKAIDNFNYVYPDLLAHHIPVEVHTFAGVPHGKAGAAILGGNYPSFDLWVPLADAFLQDLISKKQA